ncbi:Stabilin-2 [Hondaea fermentalgiana]|uniref:Stabilin-2 n=1 Tax=Hondaea fermentalgiana TaxID=2315210 RepID=A0A2R5FZK5_9STRA|nr:Stabilin-2 [Hondaea fermentalgiana]|eukprot:GBG24197.1 Stabilin-2 [Hondaea fermentalgiana]
MSECACGLTGATCSVLAEGLADFSRVLEGPCVYGECEIINGSPTCDCDAGYRDEMCDRYAEAIPANYAAAIGFPLVMMILCFFLLWKKASASFDVPRAASTHSPWRWAGPRVILVFRSVIFLYWIILQIRQQVRTDYSSLRFFTVWNSYLLLAYFALGVFLSVRSLVREPSGPMGKLERVHWVVSQVEFACAMLVACVTWGILLPSAAEDNREMFLNLESYSQHAANVVLMGIDFFLCGYIAVPVHLPFLWFWGSLYSLFHGFYMLARDQNGMPLEPVYPFLTTESSLLIVWLLGLLLVLTLFAGIVFLLSKLKRRCLGDDLLVLVDLEAERADSDSKMISP